MTNRPEPAGNRSIGYRPTTGYRLTREVTAVTAVTDPNNSVETQGTTDDGRTDNQPRRRRGAATRMGKSNQHMTIAAFCGEFEIAKSTFYDWRAKGRAPKCIKLPNGDLRIRRADLDAWISACEEAAQ